MTSNDYERFDGLFTTIASGVNGIEPLMDAFFGFLGRKTDFYQVGGSEKDDPAQTVTLQYFEKHRESAIKRYEVEKERNRKVDEERRKRKQVEEKKELQEFRKKQEDLKSAPRVEEVFEEEEKTNEKIVDLKEAIGSDMNGDIKMKNEDIDDDEDSSKGVPVGNGGQTDKYVWTQTLSTLDVLIDVSPGTTARQCKVIMTPSKLKIEIKGEILIDGTFHESIKADDSVWTLEDNKVLHLTLEKKAGMTWWKCVLKGDAEIDTQKIVPENSKVSDLDADLRQTVEKMMYDQEMKARGLPTSSQSKQASILESFKKSHPEMDFSQAKINWGGGSDANPNFNM